MALRKEFKRFMSLLLAVIMLSAAWMYAIPNRELSAAKVKAVPQLNKTSVNVLMKKSVKLKLKKKIKGAKIRWKSSKKKIAKVNKKGKVTGRKKGNAKITATVTVKGKKRKLVCKVRVIQKAKSIAITYNNGKTGKSISLKQGNAVSLGVRKNPSKSNDVVSSWKSSNTKAVRVDRKGRITAVKQGNAVITAMMFGKAKASIRVTVTAGGVIPTGNETAPPTGTPTGNETAPPTGTPTGNETAPPAGTPTGNETAPPTGTPNINEINAKITVVDSFWESFLEIITFGILHDDEQEVQITADSPIGIKKIEYCITAQNVGIAQIDTLTFIEYDNNDKPVLQKGTQNIVYAKVTDNEGGILYIRSDGIGIKTDGGDLPTDAPTVKPTTPPTVKPTTPSTVKPTTPPTVKPTVSPTTKPTAVPTPGTPGPTLSPVPRFTLVDFEDQSTGADYQYTEGDGKPTTVRIVADPVNTGGKSLQITTNDYNQAAVVPIELPYELKNYKTFSFKFRLLDGVDLNDKEMCVYIAKSASAFVKWGFGNGPTDGNQFAANLVGQLEPITFTDEYKNKWTEFTISVNPDQSIQDLKGSLVLAIGANHGKNKLMSYLIDDLEFKMKDDFKPTPIPPKPSAPQPPSVGAAVTGEYRNLFKELGKTDAEINDKLEQTWDRLFYGNDDEKLYYLDPTDPNKAYIYNSELQYNDVRSEGMSYGMMMCVQLDKKEEFDKLWNWTKTYMQNDRNTRGRCRGYFAWQCSTSGQKIDISAAPDGEMYFVTSLLFASNRWGDGQGIFNYGKEARQILFDMLRRYPGTLDEWGDGSPPMFDLNNYLPVFVPYGNSASFTDPSYQLPAFYEVWARELEKEEYWDVWSGNEAEVNNDIEFWKNSANASRELLRKAVNPTTGLGPDYCEFDGRPRGGEHADFRYDAWRIAMNIGMDYAWWAEDPWQLEFANTIQSFFNSKGIGDYHNKWTLDGREVEGNNHAHSPGLVACNAVASLAASDKVAWDFLEEFWNTGLTGGQYRYYDGCLYMLGLLHCTGNFKIYTSDTIVPGVKNSSITPASATFDKKEDLQKDIEVTMTLNGNELVNILNGSAPLRVNTDYSVNGSIVTLKKSYLASQENGSLKLTFDFSEGADRTLTVTIKESSDIPLSTEHIFSSGYDTGMVKFALNSGTAAYLSAGVGGKTDVLEITLNTKQNYEVVVFPFNIGSDKLSDYASIEVELAASNGNATYKNFSAYVAQIGGAFSHCDSGTSNLKITGSSRGLNNGSEWQLWSQPLTLSGGAENLTGIIEIGFGIPEYTEAGLKYQIKSIRLIKK